MVACADNLAYIWVASRSPVFQPKKVAMIGSHSASGSDEPPRPPRTDPDADILPSLKRGDPAALSALMDRHLKNIKSMAWHMLGDEMLAEDITQEVFIKAWIQAPNWQAGQAKFSTWMHRVGKNLCYDRLRKKIEIFTDTVPDILDERTGSQDMIETEQTHTIQKRMLNEAMNTLTEGQRMAITLCHYQNLSQIEAAAVMETSIHAYESLLARGRKKLHAYLQSHKPTLLEH